MNERNPVRALSAWTVLTCLLLPSISLFAGEESIEEMTVTGLRGKPRTAIDSAVPIDVFSASTIESVSFQDTQDILQTLVPSYNVSRQPISDGSTFIRPAELRGLPSHHTLVLVNGKRRHRASLVVIGGSGTQGPDVATIPSYALENIEVLRDGASSQYGSDAIAGVINFNLKSNRDGFGFAVDTGEFFEGDGFQTTIQGNVGLPLGESGFLSISGEWNDAEFTQRDEQYCESWWCVNPNSSRFDSEAGYAAYVLGQPDPTATARVQALQSAYPGGVSSASVEGNVVQPWGQPNTDSIRLFYNAGLPLDNGMEIYSFGNYSLSNGDGSFFYRYPGNGTIEDLRLADGSIYSPLEIFPGGFTPRFEGEVEDMSFLAGVRGDLDTGLSWDVSLRWGINEIDYTLRNTINPSLGPDTPTSFRPGTLSNEEIQFQIDFVQELDWGFAVPAQLAFGFSYFDETYDVQASSDVASYEAGPFASQDPFELCTNEVDFSTRTATAAGAGIADLDCTSSSDPVYTVVGVGSNGFPGYSPAFSDEYTRDSFALYLDLSADVTEKLLLSAAVRYEDYSDFGDEVVGKLAARYRINDALAIRGSFGTGFRAPTPGQQGTTNVSTRLPNGFPVATGLFPAGGPVAQALGAEELAPETSQDLTFGVTLALGGLTATIDYYQIRIDDRFRAISVLDVSTDPTSGSAYDNFLALQAAGVSGANSIGGVNYFQNAFDSETTGVDLVATYPFEWSNGQTTTLTAAVNYNKSELASNASAFLNGEDQFDFENIDPNYRGVFTVIHEFGKLSLLGRASYYGESEDGDNIPLTSSGDPDVPNAAGLQKFDAITLVDVEGTYRFNENFRVSVGGRNIFDEFPDEIDRTVNDNDYCCGRVYASGSIVPWQGGYWYLRFNADFF